MLKSLIAKIKDTLLTDDTAVIMTLSEQGKTKRELTIPTYIDWYRVTEIGKKDDTNVKNS